MRKFITKLITIEKENGRTTRMKWTSRTRFWSHWNRFRYFTYALCPFYAFQFQKQNTSENPLKLEAKEIQGNSRKFEEIQGDSRKFKEIQGNSKKFKEIQWDSRKFKKIQRNSRKFEEIQGNSKKFKEIQGNSRKLPFVGVLRNWRGTKAEEEDGNNRSRNRARWIINGGLFRFPGREESAACEIRSTG